METPELRCLNCGTTLPASSFKMCFDVMVCEHCHGVAQIIYDRGRSELRTMLTLMRESIRLALIEGRLTLPEPAAKPSKREILRTILQLVETRDERTSATGRDGGGGVRDTVPSPGLPGEGDRVPPAWRGVATGDDGPGGPDRPGDRQVPDVQALPDDGHEST